MKESANQDAAIFQNSLNPRDRKMLERIETGQSDIKKMLAALYAKLDAVREEVACCCFEFKLKVIVCMLG